MFRNIESHHQTRNECVYIWVQQKEKRTILICRGKELIREKWNKTFYDGKDVYIVIKFVFLNLINSLPLQIKMVLFSFCCTYIYALMFTHFLSGDATQCCSSVKVELNYWTIVRKRWKKSISLSMFSRKLGQKVCEGGQLKSEVRFN